METMCIVEGSEGRAGQTCYCVLETILERGLSLRKFEEKKALISGGRPMPNLPDVKIKTEQCIRHFNSDNKKKMDG